MPHVQQQKHERIYIVAVWIGILVFLFGLSQFAYAGTFSRFWADDYCYSAALKNTSLFNALVDWYRVNGNRVSTLVVVAFADLFGWRSIQISPLMVLGIWVWAWAFFLSQLARLLSWKLPNAWVLLLALIEVYFVVYLAPDRVQTIYWRMGTYHYTLPLQLLLINLGILMIGFRQPGKRAAWCGAVSMLLAFFAAGLSETFAALQSGTFALAVAAAIILSPRHQRGKAAGMLSAALAGSLLMMVVMSQAPANSWRQDVMPPPDNILLIVPYSLRYAGDYIFYTLRGQVTPFLIYSALLFSMGATASRNRPEPFSVRQGFATAAAAVLITYALIVCSFAPSAYANLSYPAGRALMPSCFALLAGIGCSAVSLGFIVRSMIAQEKEGLIFILATMALVLMCLYPIRSWVATRREIDQLSTWADRWDARDQQIRQEVASGKLDVTVKQVNVIEGLEDMGPDATHWINGCAASFYDVNSITAEP